ncbi:hypothetical protein [Bordetella genomosp. 1]|nr:hypothetical protein [Bordetella genomosp. 1]
METCMRVGRRLRAALLMTALLWGMTGPAGAQPQPRGLGEEPQVRAGLLDLLGYARGSYTMPQALVLTQVLQAVHSEADRKRIALEGGAYLLASLDETTLGRDRAALLFDAQDRLQGVGLVNGQCHLGEEGLLDCRAEDHAWLSVFVPARAPRDRDAGIVAALGRWAAQAPTSARTGEAPAAQRISNVEVVPVDGAAQTWGTAQLPPGFPLAFVALAPGHVALETAAGRGAYTFPPALAGLPLVNDWDEQEGRPMREFELSWRSYTPYAAVYAQSLSRAGGARLQRGFHAAVMSGERDGYSYMLKLEDEGVAGVLITLALWRGTLPQP